MVVSDFALSLQCYYCYPSSISSIHFELFHGSNFIIPRIARVLGLVVPHPLCKTRNNVVYTVKRNRHFARFF